MDGAHGPGFAARRCLAAVVTGAFTVTVPGTVAGLVPYRVAGRRVHAPLLGVRATRVLGAALVAAGAPLVADSFVRFVKAAGTPHPAFETDELVVTGLYRHVRNPQYVGIVTMLAGQSLLYGSRRVLAYTVVVAALFHLWVVAFEERRLRRRFGTRYERYVASTPRWVPRPRPAAS